MVLVMIIETPVASKRLKNRGGVFANSLLSVYF